MRKNVIGAGLTFDQQDALASEKGVLVSDLLQRVLFNFLSEKIRMKNSAGESGAFVRTSTITQDSKSLCCNSGGTLGLGVFAIGPRTTLFPRIGIAVALPMKEEIV